MVIKMPNENINNKMEEGLDGGLSIKDRSTKKEILRIKVNHNETLILFQVKDKEKGMKALDRFISIAHSPFTDIPLVDMDEMLRKSQNLVVYEKRPNNDETGYQCILVTNYWTGKPTEIAIRAFEKV
jgi:hypothetical protein